MRILLRPFRVRGQLAAPLLVAFALVNGLVLVNALLHDPRIGYDAAGYLAYVEALSQGRIPTPEDTYQYLSPPLPFALPAAVRALTRQLGVEETTSRMLSWKIGQLANVAWSLALTFSLLEIGRAVDPASIGTRLGSLILLGMLPVYHKAFGSFRAEPAGAALTVVTLCAALWALRGPRPSTARFLAVGILGGALALTRQWSLAVLAAIAAMGLVHLLCQPGRVRAILSRGALAVAVAVVVGGGFYAQLVARYGSISPHQQIARFPNAQRMGFSLRNQPPSFYFNLATDRLFSRPVFPALGNRLLPVLHSTLWGDYWGYWVVATRDLRDGSYLDYPSSLPVIRRSGGRPAWMWTNRDRMQPYLGRVNAVSLAPAALLVASLALGIWSACRTTLARDASVRAEVYRFATAIVVASLAAYFYFLVVTPDRNAGTPIKATYLLQIFPLWCLLAAMTLQGLRGRSAWAHRLVVGAVLLALAYDAPVLVTRFQQWPW